MFSASQSNVSSDTACVISTTQQNGSIASHVVRRRMAWWLWLLALVPLFLMMCAIGYYGVDLIRWDEWHVTNFPYRFEKLEWRHFLFQQNESRPLFPRLFLIGLGWLTDWNTKVEMFLTLGMIFLTSLGLFKMARRLLPEVGDGRAFWAFFAMNLVLFSPFQTELGWGFQILVHIPAFCLVLAMMAGMSRRSFVSKCLVGGMLATVATWSYANGMLLWGLVPLFLVLANPLSIRKKIPGLILLALLGGANLWLYFYNFTKPSGFPSYLAFTSSPLDLPWFFCTFFGAPLAWLQTNQSYEAVKYVGAFLLILFILCCGVMVWERRQRDVIRRGLPWVMIGLYSLLSGATASLGRFGFGPNYMCVSTRYAAFSNIMIVALIFLVPVCFQVAVGKSRFRSSGSQPLLWPVNLLLVILLVSECTVYVQRFRVMGKERQELLQARVALMFLPVVETPELNLVHPDMKFLRKWGPILNQKGFLRLPMVHPLRFMDALRRPEGSNGVVEGIIYREDGTCDGWGWAYCRDKRELVGGVVLTWQPTPEATPTPVSLVFPSLVRPDLASLISVRRQTPVGWWVRFTRPAASGIIKAWAVDGQSGDLSPLASAPAPIRASSLAKDISR